MSKYAVLLFLILLSYNPHTCRTQRTTGTPIIIATENVLAMTAATVKSANIDAAKTQVTIRESIVKLQQNATSIQEAINAVVNDAMTNFQNKIDSLGMNSVDVAVNDCGIPDTSVESIAARILMDANSCVSKTVKSIERELNDTYSSIESTLAKINSEQNLAETCVAEYYKTDMGLLKAILTGICVTQSKGRILTAIKNELSTWSDAAFIDALYTDGTNRLSSCNDSSRISSFLTDMDYIYNEFVTCISN